MANQSILRKKFPQDFFSQATDQPARYRSPQPGEVCPPGWMKASIRDIRSSSETWLETKPIRASIVAAAESVGQISEEFLPRTQN